MNRSARSWICETTNFGLASLTSRAVRISRARSGADEMINHGSTAMQCPPTPGPGCSAEHLRLQKNAIDRFGVLGAGFGHPADNAIVLDQLSDHPPGEHPLRAMRHMHIERLGMPRRGKAQIRAQLRQTIGQPAGCADRRGRLEDHDIAGDENGRDRVCRQVDKVEIG